MTLKLCRHILLFCAALYSMCPQSSAGNGFNSVLSKHIAANVTCGDPPEVYYRTQEGILHPRLRNRLVCDANDPKNAHPPENMIDGDLATFWQSKASVDKAEIRINLNQEVFAYEISVTFGDYRRPEQIAFRRSKDYGTTFEPWHFLVSPPAMDQCLDVFGVDVTSGPQKVDTVMCQQYPNYFPLEYNETFTVDMNGQQRGDGSSDSDYHSPEILSWMKITNLEIIFTGLYQKFDRLSTAWHHYAVREIGLRAKCNCNGYADGFDCSLNSVNNLRECKCKGNTCGVYCHMCCSAFNQYPWQQGNGAPWVWNGTATCEACNCHNHSDVCVYNQTVADGGLSLDINDQRKGGGVCVNCKHNTEGINCEKCTKFYYRALNQSKISPDTCKECGCNGSGTLDLPKMTFLDCVRDELEMKSHGNKKPGDCYCKKNVFGRTCAVCRDEFYQLNSNNADGCKGCQCHLPGTVNRSNICTKDDFGQCPCKENTHGRDCTQCKQGYYNLSDQDIGGCKDCGCDPGAVIPGMFCNNITGSCECLPHIYGKLCKSIEIGCYYPDLHYISAEKDLYQAATARLSVLLDIPRDGYFRIMIDYSLKTSDSAEADVQLISSSDHTIVNSTSTTFSMCTTNCYHRLTPTFLHLSKGKVRVVVNSTQEDLKLYKVVAIPREFYMNSILGARASSHFQFQCNIDDNDMRVATDLEGFCLSNVFSLTIAYNKGPLNCSCNPIGSYNSTRCDSHGGQCHCKPGVTGRDCSQCLPEFYNFSNSGCTPCGCQGENKICNITTGWCECPPNTTLRTCEPCECNGNSDSCLRSGLCLNCKHNSAGFHCERCSDGTYGNATAADCKDCKCHTPGSTHSICDITTGQCQCKPNVVGRNCSQCRANTYKMDENGCLECQCNAHGSSSLQCDETGQCSCLADVTGIKCTQCIVGYYGLPEKSCRACGCSSIGSVNGTVCANDELGMCTCKPGVSGRACDSCQKQYTNFTSSGCSRCSACPRNLQNVLDTTVIVELVNISIDLMDLQNFSSTDGLFQNTTKRLEMAKLSSDQYASRIDESKKQCEALIFSFAVEFGQIHKAVDDENKRLMGVINLLETRNKNALKKVSVIKNKTTISKNFTEGIHEFLESITKAFDNLTESTIETVSKAQALYIHLSNVNLVEEINLVEKTLKKARNLSQTVGNISDEVEFQKVLGQALEFSIDEAMKYFVQKQNESERDHDAFVEKILNIYGSFSTATELVENIKKINKESKTLLQKATEILKENDNVFDEAQQNLEKAKETYQKFKNVAISVQGELEISMLQYDFKESVFLMKILQARDLLARDFPSSSSDPYAIISIVPAWRDQGSQKSRIMNGTTSPVFPFYDIFRFNIGVKEIPETKVIITLYDYDADDVDDCLGEVVIDLVADEFFNKIVTKWFKVQPKGTTGLNSRNFNPDGIGLIDMNTLLQIQINELRPRINITESKLAEAKANVTNLRNIVDSMNRSLQQAFSYTRRPVESITRYETVSQIISNVVNQVNRTKKAVDNLTEFLSQKSIQDINEHFERAYKEIQEFHQTTLRRNLTPPTYLETAILAANNTFRSALLQWQHINQYFSDLQSKTSQFQKESLKDSSIHRLTAFAANVSRICVDKIKRLTSECEKLALEIDVMASKIAQVVSASANQTKIINAGASYITKAEAKLNTRPNPSENVLAALPIHEHFEQTRDSASRRISILEEKVIHISMNLSRTFNVAMRFMGDGAVLFTPSELFLKNKLSDEIIFDFKTNTSKGGIIYIVTSRLDLSQSIRMFINSGKLCSSTDLGHGPNTICHPERVDNGNWYRALFTRYGTYYSLTVIRNDGQYTSVNMSTTQDVQEASYNEDTIIYVGGLPSEILPGVVSYYDYYNGVIDHMRLKTDRFLLWRSERKYSQQLYYPNKIFPKHPPGPIYEASFFGTGSLRHKIGDFSINVSRVAVQIELRTLHESGVLLEVLNTSNAPLFGIYLAQGNIKGFLVIGASRNVTLTSSQSSYADGKWHRIRFNVTNDTAVLQIKTSGSGTQDTRSLHVTGASSTQDGSILMFGGTNTNSSTPSLTRIPFAGDMKNIWLSSKDMSEEMIKRDLVGPEWIKDKGVGYEGIIKEKIYAGYRFYGYLPYTGHGSYAALSAESELVSHLMFTFKTVEKNGVLVYSTNKNVSKNDEKSTFFYMALWNGYLYISYHNGDFKNNIAPFYYKNRKLNDNKWHIVSLNFTNGRSRLLLNGKTIHTGWFGNVRTPLVPGRTFYVGGVEPKVPIILPVPVYWSFEGAFQSFFVNLRELNLLTGKSEGVSFGGVSPSVTVPVSTTFPPSTTPTAAPQCQTALGRPKLSNDIGSLRFGGSSFDYNSTSPSYVGFNWNEKHKDLFKSSIVITLEMRSLTMNGLIFYAADSETDSKNFISLELVNGRLRYQFRSATGQVTIETTRRYALDGVWYKFYLLRIFQFGAIVIPKTKEYHNNRHQHAASMMTISTPLYIGGLPNHVNASGLINTNLGFVGCLRNFGISSSHEDVDFDVTRPDFKGSSTGPCYHQLEPGVYLNGEAWMKFGNVVLSQDFTISLSFRTHKRSGLIFAVDSLKGRGLVLQQKLGQLVLNYTTGSQNVQLTWSPSSSNTSSVKESFVICQMEWYNIEISRKSNSLRMLVNKAYEVHENVSVTDFTGNLSLGKLTESELTVDTSPFYGCLKQLVIDGAVIDLSRPSSQANTELSCPVISELSGNIDENIMS